ncbi:MAG: HAD family hydrolase [Ruminococcaceae bacterium]|nr:HAD family hydrolase [Oscillospiraceae bacterium]
MAKAVIFDLDGTLLNSLGDLTGAVNHALTVQGFPTHTEAEVRTYVGDGVRQLIARSCPPGTDEATQEAVLATYLPHYAAHNRDKTTPYPGVVALLGDLKAAGYRLGVVSNKHNAGVQTLCAHFFGDLLDVTVGADDTRPRKPAPDGLLYALQAVGVTANDAWFVGDSAVDVRTAHAAGVRCAAVTWGFQDADRLLAEHPAVLVSTAEELKAEVMR